MSTIVVNLADESITDADNAVIVDLDTTDLDDDDVTSYADIHGTPVLPSRDLRDFVAVEVEACRQSYGAPDIYWNNEHDCAVLVTDRRLVEIYRNPDHEEGEELYVADYIEMHRP